MRSQLQVKTGFVLTLTVMMLALCAANAPAQTNTFPASGNVGVGTTSPVYSLDVNGGTNAFRAKASTSNSNDTIASFENNSGIVGIFRANGFFGIGTTNPGSMLAIQKDQASGTEIRVTNNNTAGFSGVYLNGLFAGTSGGFLQYNNTTGFKNLFVATGGADPLYLGTENTIRMTIVPVSGSVGIGTTTPNSAYRVDVSGKVNASTGLCIAGDCKTAWSQVGGGSSQWTTIPSTTNIAYSGGNVGVGTSSPVFSMDVNGGVNAFRVKAASTSSGDAIASFENSSGIVGIMRANGNFGIGLPNPAEKLEVNGNLKVSGTGTGNITATGTIEGSNVKAKYQDVAEWVDSTQELAAGTVVVLDRSKSNHVIAATKSYDSRVAGVISLQPGVTLGEGGEGRVLVAATGRVKVKVDAGNGAIEIGDLLVTSDKEGTAMKSVPVNIGGVLLHRPGTLIGKALEPLDKGTGEILVLLSLQ